jgi:molybdate transport system regulatory protein
MYFIAMNYKIKSRIWIECEEGMFLGNGRVQLLKSIAECGSVSQAAKNLGMSYKKAWNLVDAVNNKAKETVVLRSAGGKDGGGTLLTEYGKQLIKQFEDANAKTIAFINQLNIVG